MAVFKERQEGGGGGGGRLSAPPEFRGVITLWVEGFVA